MQFSDDFVLTYSENQIEFGESNEIIIENQEIPVCTKNVDNVIMTFEDIKDKIIGATVTSAADFQNYIELGIDGKLNLGLIPQNRIHVMIFNEVTH